MASHIGSGGSGRSGSRSLDQRLAFGQCLLREADAVAGPDRLPQDDLVVGAKAERMPVDDHAQRRKAADQIVAAVKADQIVGEQILGRSGRPRRSR